MHPAIHAAQTPERPAIVMAANGQTRSYSELDAASNRIAQLFRRLGLRKGDAISLLVENCPAFLEICWAAQRAGLYFTPIPTHLRPDEVRHIVEDSGSRLLIVSSSVAESNTVDQAVEKLPALEHLFVIGGPAGSNADWHAAVANCAPEPIADEAAGQLLAYSSGTTGKPKGVKLPLGDGPAVAESPLARMFMHMYGISTDGVYLSPGPLYHTAPLASCMSVHRVGGCVVLMDKFEAEPFLETVERHAVTHTQMVPTMFVRLLKLPKEVRDRYRLDSLRCAIHAAAPCPIPVKRQMIDWWGPILHEYYGGTESIGSTAIDSRQWLEKPGSVGRANWGSLHICDDQGRELPPRQQGLVYFGGAANFSYHNDPRKTSESRHPQHPDWATLGDIGYVDEEGYLFLTDRKAFMIISGGVNIYPQEAENVLVDHPRVADAAVIGVPNEEFGEEVRAVVQPLDWSDATPDFARELIAYCRQHLSPVKCPRGIDFEQALPREANGKLYKKRLRDRYWNPARR